MKPIQIHPLSALFGAGALGLVTMLVSAQQSTTTATQVVGPAGTAEAKVVLSGPIQVDGIPTPKQMLAIYEAGAIVPTSDNLAVAPYTVPAGKAFVVTGFLRTANAQDSAVELKFNTNSVASGECSASSGRITPVPAGLVASEGTLVECEGIQGIGVVLGYLADA